MQRGYIKLYRSLLDADIMRSPELCTLFLFLLLRAASRERVAVLGTETVQVLPGQVLVGRRKLAADLALSERKIRTCLATLERMEVVTLHSTARYTVVTFVNWQRYQATPGNTRKDQETPGKIRKRRNRTNNANRANNANITN